MLIYSKENSTKVNSSLRTYKSLQVQRPPYGGNRNIYRTQQKEAGNPFAKLLFIAFPNRRGSRQLPGSLQEARKQLLCFLLSLYTEQLIFTLLPGPSVDRATQTLRWAFSVCFTTSRQDESTTHEQPKRGFCFWMLFELRSLIIHNQTRLHL